MKISTFAVLATISTAAAFAPSRSFAPRIALHMSEEAEIIEAAAPAAAPVSGGALVPMKEETIEFTAGIIGGAAGLLVGGPVFGAIGAAVANYASKNEEEIGVVVQAVSKTSIEVFNYLAKLDGKYEVLKSAQSNLGDAIEKVKKNGDSETLEKLETAYASTTAKINEINDEYDLVGASLTAFGVVGDLVEKAVAKAGELNEEYKLTDKAMESINKAVSSAKSA